MSAIGRQDRSQGLLRSEQRLDRCDSHQILHGMGELPIERDQSVGLELGQGDVLGVKRVRPPELVGDLPCDFLKLAVLEQPDPPLRSEEVTDRMLIFGERHLRTILAEYEAHYNGRRPHRSRHLRPPRPDHPVADLSRKRIQRQPLLGGLINEYQRAA